MTDNSSIFVIREARRERAVIAFRDWQSALDLFFHPGEATFIADIRTELENLIAAQECKVLAVDVAPVDLMPTAFLGVLAAIQKSGITVEVLNPSASVRAMLESTRLNRYFVVKD